MHGASAEDWFILAELGRLRQYLYQYNAEEDELYNADCIAWPILWLLVRHNRKHIFVSKKRIDISELTKSVHSFENRVRWRCHFRDSEIATIPCINYKGSAKPFTGGVRNPALEFVLRSLRSTVLETARRANTKATPKVSNVVGLTRWAWRLLRDNEYTAVPNDKEPGFTIAPIHDMSIIHQKVLDDNTYKLIDPININERKMRIEYTSLCDDIADLEHEPLYSHALRKSFYEPSATYIAKLKCTVKTTKPRGAKKIRNLHTCPNSKFACLSMWVNKFLEGALSSENHMLRDSQHLVDVLANERFPEHGAMARIDLDHFFMSGTCDQLSDAASSVISDHKTRVLVMRAIRFLLTHQYVQSKYVDGVYMVCKGSGMGLRHSSSICDAAFFALCEKPWSLKPVVQNKFRIVMYYRFKDDVFILWLHHGDITTFSNWFYSLQKRAEPVFTMKCVEFSRTSVTMLAVVVERSKVAHSRFATKPRPLSNDGPMLSVHSGHPWHVHLSWPLSVLRSKMKLSSHEYKKQAAEEFISRLRRYHCPTFMIEKLERASLEETVRSKVAKPSSSVGLEFWLVLGWHPAWSLVNLNARLVQWSRDALNLRAIRDAFNSNTLFFNVRTSWRNLLPQLMHSVQWVPSTVHDAE